MQIGIVGLGRMGGNIARRLMRNGHACVVSDRNAEATDAVVRDGAAGASGLEDLIAKLAPPRVVWVMLPAGRITDETIAVAGGLLSAGDIVIDGGNTYYKDDIRRARTLSPKGVRYVDVGTSGGVWGLERGYCMMVGGEPAAIDHIRPILESLAPGVGSIPRTQRASGEDWTAERGWIHAGPVGAGHFVKMVHNGIEYGLMQAYAEGFDILKNKNAEHLPADERYELSMTDIAEVWRRGSVVSSWLLDLTAQALAHDAQLSGFKGQVDDSGESRWTIEAAIEEAVPAGVLAASLFVRFRSREHQPFGERLLSAMRYGFGGHVEGAIEKAGQG
jgi:6-phosphogluconate dehydrogenase